MADYGKATAGGYTLDAPCGLVVCRSDAATAWWQEGKRWSNEASALVAGAAAQGLPPATWPFAVRADWEQVQGIIKFFSGSPPWFAFFEDISDYALKQQALRDFCSGLGSFLETKGIDPGKGPTEVKPASSPLETLAKLAGVGIAAYVGVNLLRPR